MHIQINDNYDYNSNNYISVMSENEMDNLNQISEKKLLVKDFFDLDFFNEKLKDYKLIFEKIKIFKLLGSGAEGKVYKSSE